MPYRAMNVAIGVFGVVVLAALVALGVNVYRAARTGPSWKRGLIAAGLAMLGLVGTTGCTTCYAFAVEPSVPSPDVAYKETKMELWDLSERVDLLERLQAEGKLDPAAAVKTLDGLDNEMNSRVNDYQLSLLSEEDRKRVVVEKKELRTRIEVLRKQVEGK